MKKIPIYLISVCLYLVLIKSISGAKENITAFCGSASKPATEEAARLFEQKTGIKVDLHFGGSGTMLSQMKLSKRGDLYIPGSPDYMIKAKREKIVDPRTVRIIAYLVPAILVQHGNPKKIHTLSDLTKPEIRIGIGNPYAVCVGLYAVEILIKSGLLKPVEKNIVTHAHSCSITASFVTMKKVDAIIGWRVFSKWNPNNIDVVYLKPDDIQRLAFIPAAISTYSKDKDSAQKFIDFLTSPEGRIIYTKWGYIATEKEAREFAPKAKIGGEYTLPKDYRPFVGK
jgi:molybdate transport system substrate-binding protein